MVKWLLAAVVVVVGAVVIVGGILFLLVKIGWFGIPVLLGLFFLFARFTLVDEGTARAVMRLRGFKRIIFQWKKHFIDNDWNIWREEEAEGKIRRRLEGRILGGLWFYGIWPLDKIHTYPLRWTDLRRVEEAGEKIEKPQFHEEERRNYVMLKPAVYWTKIFKAETRPPERIPVDIEILVTMRVINPYLFLFVAPPTPLEDVLARIDALMRARVSMVTVDEIIGLKGKSEVLWDGQGKIPGLRDEKLIVATLPKWGLQIAKKGIDIKSIGLSPEYQEAAAAKREQEMRADGRAEELTGTAVVAVARLEGRDEKEVQEEFRKDPEAFYRKHKVLIDNIMTKLSVEERLYFRVETPGATGMEGAFLRLATLLKKMPMGEKTSSEKEERLTSEEKIKRGRELLQKHQSKYGKRS